MSNSVCRTQQGRHNSSPLRKILGVFLFRVYQKFCTFDTALQTKKISYCQNVINLAPGWFIKESSVLIRRDGTQPETPEPRQPGPFPSPGSWMGPLRIPSMSTGLWEVAVKGGTRPHSSLPVILGRAGPGPVCSLSSLLCFLLPS